MRAPTMSEVHEAVWLPTNRQRTQEPRGRSFWCCCCDAEMVRAGEKCRKCHARSGKPGRLKKSSLTNG